MSLAFNLHLAMQLLDKKIKTSTTYKKISYLGNLSLFEFKLDDCNSSGENWFTNGNKDLTIITDIKCHM